MAKAAAKARNSQSCGVRIDAALGHQVRHREGALVDAQPQDGQQHQDGAGHGVQEELDGGVDAARSAPDADQEVHRDEREFPEDVEQEQVLRQEDAHHAHFQQQEEEHEILDALFDRRPGGQDGDGGQEGGQQHQQDAQAVHAASTRSMAQIITRLDVHDPADHRRPTTYGPVASPRALQVPGQTAGESSVEVGADSASNSRWIEYSGKSATNDFSLSGLSPHLGSRACNRSLLLGMGLLGLAGEFLRRRGRAKASRVGSLRLDILLRRPPAGISRRCLQHVQTRRPEQSWKRCGDRWSRFSVWRGVVAGADSEATAPAVHVTSARSAVAKTIKIKTPAPLRLPFQNNQNKDSRPFTPSPAGLLFDG